MRWECQCCRRWNKKSEEGCGVCGRPRTYRVREGTNPLRLASHLAALRVEHVIPYLRQFPDPGGPRGPINARDAQGFTAVHVAAAAGNAEILQILIENGGFVEAQTNRGSRPIEFATKNEECARVLLRAGAEPRGLHDCETGDLARLLISNGADPLAHNGVPTTTPLHRAAERDNAQVARAILEAAPQARNQVSGDGWLPGAVAAYRNNTTVPFFPLDDDDDTTTAIIIRSSRHFHHRLVPRERGKSQKFK